MPESQRIAQAIFDSKHPLLSRMIAFRCRERGLQRHEEDSKQLAALHLWQQCVRLADPAIISCEVLRRKVFRIYFHHKRPVTLTDAAAADDVSLDAQFAPEAVIVVDGARLTVADAWMDDPAGCRMWEAGLTTREAAQRLGVTEQRIGQVFARLGGRDFREPGRRRPVRRFPPDLSRAYLKRPRPSAQREGVVLSPA